MRRVLVIGAVTGIVLIAFAAGKQRFPIAIAGGPQAAAPASASRIVSSSQVSVVAANLAPRALALNPTGTIDLTNATAPNQVLVLGVGASASGLPAANPRIAAVAGTGAAGSLGDGGAATSAQLSVNSGSFIERSEIAVGADGAIFVADTGNATIRAIAGASSTEPGVIRSVAGRWAPRQNLTLADPLGVAIDGAGNLYISDHATGAVDVLSAATGQLATLAHVAAPASIAVARNGGKVFVASPDNGQVFAIDTQSHAISTVAGTPGNSTQPSSACVDAGTASAQICPAGLAVDGASNLFIADANSGQILRIDARTGLQTVAASGLNQPGALAIDGQGNLYAAEQGQSRIVAFAQLAAGASSITLSPASAAFGNAPSGGATATQQFTLTNTSTPTSTSSGTVTGISIPKTTTPADFTVENTNCTATLAAGASCTLNVAFTPTTSGARSGSISVTDANATDSASASFTGTGDDYEIQLAGSQLTTISVQAGNAATFNLQVVPDKVFSGGVALVCPNNLPTNTTCAFSTSTVNVSAGSAAPFQVTFQTTGIINPLATHMSPGPRGGPRFSLFPALALAVILCGFLAVEWFFWPNVFGVALARRFVPIFAMGAIAAAILAGCHSSKTNASIGATPIGQTNLQITGNTQNASRALTITLDVIAQP